MLAWICNGSDLPLSHDLPPLILVGIRYFGPTKGKEGQNSDMSQKRHVTYFNTRAVHLEMAYSLNIDSCICALRKFFCRVQVKEIICDNGTKLVRGDQELREALADFNQDRIQKTLLRKSVVDV